MKNYTHLAGKIILLYQGTRCYSNFMDQITQILKEYGATDIKQVCWTKVNDDFNKYNYLEKQWNIQKGSYDIVIGHSAGCFPLTKTKGIRKIAINPPFRDHKSIYVFRANKDILGPPILHELVQNSLKTIQKFNLKLLHKKFIKMRKVIIYNGTHSTIPEEELRLWIESNFQSH